MEAAARVLSKARHVVQPGQLEAKLILVKGYPQVKEMVKGSC